MQNQLIAILNQITAQNLFLIDIARAMGVPEQDINNFGNSIHEVIKDYIEGIYDDKR